MNAVARFTGMRDVPGVSRSTLPAIGIPDGRVGVAVLTGGAILAGADVFAQAMRAGVARPYVLVGGAGHTTDIFRAHVRELCPETRFANDASEAEVFDTYLRARHGLSTDLLKTRSTNSGDSITFLFRLLRGHGIKPKALLLIQDATMQWHPGAVVRHQEHQVRVVNYAAYRTRIVVRATAGEQPASPDSVLDSLIYADEPSGMWDIDRYLTLLMGEIPRLTGAPRRLRSPRCQPHRPRRHPRERHSCLRCPQARVSCPHKNRQPRLLPSKGLTKSLDEAPTPRQ